MHKKNRKLPFYQLIYIIIIILLFLINSEIVNAEMFGLIWDYKCTGNVTGVSVSLDGKYIAVGCSDNKIYYINNKGKLLWTYNTEFPIKGISVFENGDSIAATGDNNNLFTPEGKFYALNSKGEILQNTKCASISSFSFSEDGKYYAMTVPRNLGMCDGIYFNKDGNLLWEHTTTPGSQGESTISISSDGNYIAVGMKSADMFSQKGGIYLLNRTGKIIWEYIISGSHMFNKYLVSISRDGKYIASGHENSNILYYLNNSGRLLWEYNSSNYVKAISVSKDGKYVTFYNKENILYLLNYQGQLIWNKKINSISSVSISGDGNSIVVGSLDNKVYCFENLQIVAQRFINEAKSSISQEKLKGIILSEADSLFSQSENAFKGGDYTKAKDLAEQARNNAIKISKEADNTNLLIDKTRIAIYKDEYNYIINKSVEPFLKSTLSQSEDEFKKGNYSKAYLLAERGYKIAIDIDQDGVPNKKDFIPTINNTYIYIGLIILFLNLIIILSYIRRKRAIAIKIKNYREKLKQWEIEGYNISKFNKRWFQ